MLLNGYPGGFVFSWSRLPEKGAQFFFAGIWRKNAATLMMDCFLLADSKLEVYQEWVLLLKQLKMLSKSIMSMKKGH